MDMPTPDRSNLKIGTSVDFERLEVPLLNPAIRSVQSLTWFEGRVVLGTALAAVGVSDRLAARTPEGARGQARTRTDDGAQIVTFDPAGREWQKIYESPLVTGADGKSRARDRSIRAAIVCQTASDTKPCLYVAASALAGGVVFLRSDDGCWMQESDGSGLDLEEDTPSVGTLACLRGRLFATPGGRYDDRGVLDETLTECPAVVASSAPLSGNWLAASEPGFGDAENLSIGKLAVFNDHLYAVTLNPRRGFEVWKTAAEGNLPYRWHKIIDCGAWLGATSGAPTAVAVFHDALYISATVHRSRAYNLERFGPFPAEMIRVHADDTWDLVTGKARCTPCGWKSPITGLTGGFGDPFARAFASMTVHQGKLYAAATSWRSMPTFLRGRTELSQERIDRLRTATEMAPTGGVTLWRTIDGTAWDKVTAQGLSAGSRAPSGIRQLLSTPEGLFVVPNTMSASGPIELWWGHF